MLFISANCISQEINFKATYGVKTNIDFSKIKNIDTNDIFDLKKVIDDSNKPSPAKFELLFNGYESLFFYKSGLNPRPIKIDLASLKAKLLGKIYTNLKTKKIIQQKESVGVKFRIKRSLEDYKWQLFNEKIQFGEYTCYKAIFKDNSKKINKITEAWYTPNINANTGPIGFGGLPGLIMVLKNDIFTYYLESLSFNSKKVKIIFPSKGKLVTMKEYDSIYNLLYAKKERLEMDKY